MIARLVTSVQANPLKIIVMIPQVGKRTVAGRAPSGANGDPGKQAAPAVKDRFKDAARWVGHE